MAEVFDVVCTVRNIYAGNPISPARCASNPVRRRLCDALSVEEDALNVEKPKDEVTAVEIAEATARGDVSVESLRIKRDEVKVSAHGKTADAEAVCNLVIELLQELGALSPPPGPSWRRYETSCRWQVPFDPWSLVSSTLRSVVSETVVAHLSTVETDVVEQLGGVVCGLIGVPRQPGDVQRLLQGMRADSLTLAADSPAEYEQGILSVSSPLPYPAHIEFLDRLESAIGH